MRRRRHASAAGATFRRRWHSHFRLSLESGRAPSSERVDPTVDFALDPRGARPNLDLTRELASGDHLVQASAAHRHTRQDVGEREKLTGMAGVNGMRAADRPRDEIRHVVPLSVGAVIQGAGRRETRHVPYWARETGWINPALAGGLTSGP